MTRINTNISSLTAQKNLARTNAQLQEALTRLSTGLRINTGKDDPAGLIASEILRSDIVSTQKAITNSQRANQMIATADSALGQVSSLLNDIRALVEEAANKGALSQEQIGANQLQIDSSLEAIDRVAQTTQFQGRRLLDGSLDFVTQNTDATKMTDLQITQANFGTATQIGVNVNLVAQATQATLTFRGSQLASAAVVEVGGATGFETFNFGAGATVQQIATAINLVSDALGVEASLADRVAASATNGRAKLYNVGGAAGLSVTADTAGRYPGDFTVKYVKDNTAVGATASWSPGSPNVLQVTVETEDWAAAAPTDWIDVGTNGGVSNGQIRITPNIKGSAFNNVTMDYTVQGGAESVTYDYTNKKLTVIANAGRDAAYIEAMIEDKYGGLFSVESQGLDVSQAADNFTGAAVTNGAGYDGGAVAAVIDDVRDAINTAPVSNYVTALSLGTGTAAAAPDIITHSGFIGDMNAGGADDPNNRIQISTTGGAANVPIYFRASGVSQSFGIEFQQNTRTMGKSTAYIQGANAVMKVQVDNQGSEYDGITVQFANHATNKSVVWDAENRTLTVYGNLAAEDADTLAARINAAVGSTFTATVVSGGAGNFTNGNSGVTRDGAIYDGVIINLATNANGIVTSTAAEVVNAINGSAALQLVGITASHATTSTGAGTAVTGTATLTELGKTATNAYAVGTTYAKNGANARMTVTAKVAGSAYDNVKVIFANDVTAGNEYASYDATQKILTFHIEEGATSAAEMVAAFNTGSGTSQTVKDLFTVSAGGTGANNLSTDDIAWLTGGVTYTGTSLGGITSQGNFDAGDVVGTGGLNFKSVEYGSKQFVSVKALSGTFTVYDSSGTARDRVNGTDANARINGITAVADGLKLSVNTATLDLSFKLLSSLTAGTSFDFQITGGGAQFQLGPEVVSNQQTRMGIAAMNSSKLGGAAGRLYQIRSGAVYSLENDTNQAAKIVDQAITAVSTLRGLLGAFQRTTLDTNIRALNDTAEALADAESSIRDADFAAESAALTRAQILSQSGLAVLAIANNNPQQVLALLRG